MVLSLRIFDSFITARLLERITRKADLEQITALTFPQDKVQPIKVIEGLEAVPNLRSLDLSHQLVAKVERLACLKRLQVLDLSFNRIERIENLEHLGSLQILRLTGNRIARIPDHVFQKLKALRALYLDQNKLSSLQDVSSLKTSISLERLDLRGNPISELQHCNQFVVHALPHM